MIERGQVVKIKNGFVRVRIERHSACGSCGKCGMTEKQKHVDFYVENTLSAAVGDVVEINIPEANTAGLAFVGYILPLIPALILFFMSLACKWQVWLSILLFFVGLTFGFAVVAMIDKLRKHKWTQSPTMQSIITDSDSEEKTKTEINNKSNKGENENEQN